MKKHVKKAFILAIAVCMALVSLTACKKNPPPAPTGDYTVTFNSMFGSETEDVKDVVNGAKIAAPSAPGRSGYTFDGWYKDTAGQSKWDFDADTVTGNLTLYAHWSGSSGLSYQLRGAQYSVSIGDCKESRIYIQEYYAGKKVTAVDKDAFSEYKNESESITYIRLAETITDIYNGAFANCVNLEDIYFPQSLARIEGDYVFGGCDKLYDSLPDGLIYAGRVLCGYKGNFTGTTVTLRPDTVSIGDNAFYGFSSLKSIVIPAGVWHIGDYAFQDCNNLTDIVLPDSLLSVGRSVFNGTPWLDAQDDYDGNILYINKLLYSYKGSVPNGSEIDGIRPDTAAVCGNAFRNQDGLEKITIPESVKAIGHSAFQSCDGLKEVVFESGSALELIGHGAFGNCQNLKSITVPDKVTKIDMGAFTYCDRLTDVTAGAGLEFIGEHAFRSVTLTSLAVSDDNRFFKAEDGVMYNKSGTELVLYASDKTRFTVPAGVSVIAASAFENSAIERLTVSSGVTDIGKRAFYECEDLYAVVFQAGSRLKAIGHGAFARCYSLVSIVIPDSVKSIGRGAFHHCNGMFSALIGTGVEYIGENAFRYCENLFAVNFTPGGSLREIGNYAFQNCYKLDHVDIPAGATHLGEEAFQNCVSLSDIDLPDSLTEIGYLAFRDTPWLDDLYADNKGLVYVGKLLLAYCGTVPTDTVIDGINPETTAICGGAFEYQGGIVRVDIPASVKAIGERAFYQCENLAAVAFADSSKLETINHGAFARCYALKSAAVPDSVTRIGRGAFTWCEKLDNLTIGSGVKIIEEYAFRGCESLESVTIPDSITRIGYDAFLNCYALETVNIGGGLISIGDNAFSGCRSLEAINVSAGNSKYSSADGVFYNKAFTEILLYPMAKAGEDFVIPGTVTAIGANAFRICSLKTVTVPSGVSAIGESAFYGCGQLTTVTVGTDSKLEIIGNSAFLDCFNLKTFDIPDSVTRIGYSAFMNCYSLVTVIGADVQIIEAYAFNSCESLKTVVIPSGVTEVGYMAFAYCMDLETVYVERPSSAGITSINYYSFYSCSALKNVYVPDAASLEAYQTAAAGANYQSKISVKP